MKSIQGFQVLEIDILRIKLFCCPPKIIYIYPNSNHCSLNILMKTDKRKAKVFLVEYLFVYGCFELLEVLRWEHVQQSIPSKKACF